MSSDQNPPRLNEPESSTPIPSRKLKVQSRKHRGRSRRSKYTQSLCGSSAETLVHIQSHDRMRREHAPEDGSSRKCRGSPAEVPAIVHLTAEAKTQAAEAWRKRMGVDRNRQRVLNTAHVFICICWICWPIPSYTLVCKLFVSSVA